MNRSKRKEVLAILTATDAELRSAIDRLPSNENGAQSLAMLALRVPPSKRKKLAKAVQSKQSSKTETFTCRECGETKPVSDASHQLDTHASSGMCWECWLLLTA
jgi:hypothetical protein